MIALTKPFFNQDIIFILLTISFLLIAVLRASYWKYAKLLFMGVFAQRYANQYLREENAFTERVNFITFLLMTINFSLILLKFIPQTSLLEIIFLIGSVILFFIFKIGTMLFFGNIFMVKDVAKLGVFFSLFGVIVIITKADLEILLNLNFNKGDLWMVVAMFSWAIYSALLRKKKFKLSHIAFLQTIITAGLIFLLPAYLLEIMLGYKLNIHIPFLLTLSYVVLFPGLASFFFWIKGISIIGSNRSGIFLHLMPIFSILMAIIIFKEKFMNFHLVGVVFIIMGIVLSTKGKVTTK